MNVLAIGAAAVVAFVLSTVWYMVFGGRLAALLGRDPASASDRPPLWMIGVELLRSLVVASALAGFADRMDVDGVGGALLLGLVAWVAFPFVLLTGSVLWDRVPWRVAAIHGGDWLLKLLAITVIVTALG